MKRVALAFALIVFQTALSFGGQGALRVSISAPSDLSASLKFSGPSGKDILNPGETGKLVITVRNSGRGDAARLKAEVRTDRSLRGLRFDRLVEIGSVPSGKSTSREVTVRAGNDLAAGDVQFEVSIVDAGGSEADTARTTVRARAAEQTKQQQQKTPKLLVADFGINDENGNHRIDPGEKIEVVVRIQNTGLGEARSVIADVLTGQYVSLAGNKVSHFNLGTLGPRKYKDIRFTFIAEDRIGRGQPIPIAIDIGEERPQYKVTEKLGMEMNSRPKREQEIIERD